MDAQCDGGLYGHVTNYCLDELTTLTVGLRTLIGCSSVHCSSHNLGTALKIHSKSESIEYGTRVRDSVMNCSSPLQRSRKLSCALRKRGAITCWVRFKVLGQTHQFKVR